MGRPGREGGGGSHSERVGAAAVRRHCRAGRQARAGSAAGWVGVGQAVVAARFQDGALVSSQCRTGREAAARATAAAAIAAALLRGDSSSPPPPLSRLVLDLSPGAKRRPERSSLLRDQRRKRGASGTYELGRSRRAGDGRRRACCGCQGLRAGERARAGRAWTAGCRGRSSEEGASDRALPDLGEAGQGEGGEGDGQLASGGRAGGRGDGRERAEGELRSWVRLSNEAGEPMCSPSEGLVCR